MKRGTLESVGELWRDAQWPHFSVSGAIGQGAEGQDRQRQPCGRAKGQGPWLAEGRKKNAAEAPRPALLGLSRVLGKEASSGIPPESHNRGKLREQERKDFLHPSRLTGRGDCEVSIREAQPTLRPGRTNRWPLLLAPAFHSTVTSELSLAVGKALGPDHGWFWPFLRGESYGEEKMVAKDSM